MDIVHFSLPFHWPGGAGRSTENGDRRSDSAITPLAMVESCVVHNTTQTSYSDRMCIPIRVIIIVIDKCQDICVQPDTL